MADVPLRLASLMVLGGTLHGKQLVLDDLVDEILIGSDPDCRFHVDAPGVSPIHARVWVDLEGATVHDTHSPHGLYVNFDKVQDKATLQDGDMIWLGPPREPGSVMIQCQFEERGDPSGLPLPAAEEEVASAEELGVLSELEGQARHAPAPSAAEEEVASVEELGVLAELEGQARRAPAPSMAEEEVASVEELGVLAELEGQARREPPPSAAEEVSGIGEPLGVLPEPEEEAGSAPRRPAADALDEFLIMEPPGGPSPPPPPGPASGGETEFVVSGFEAEWPSVPGPPSAPAPREAPPSPPPTTVLSGDEDPFFLEGSPPPQERMPASTADTDAAFFFDEPLGAPAGAEAGQPAPTPEPTPPPVKLPSSPAPPRAGGEAPPSAGAPAESLSFESEEMFFGEPAEPVAPSSVRTAPPPTPAAPPAAAAPPVAAPPIPSPVTPPRPPEPKPEAKPAPSPPAAPARPATPAPPARPSPRREAAAPPRGERPQPARKPAKSARPAGKYAGLAAAVLLAAGGGGYLAWRSLGAARLDAVEPTRVRVGQAVILTGKGFSGEAKGNEVLFGEKAGTVVKASPTRLDVEVPDIGAPAGQEVRLPVHVRVGGGDSRSIEIAISQGPTLHGISPDVAMPGDEVMVAGVGWGPGAVVRFGGVPAEILETKESSLRVRVPPLPGGPGTSAPVVVAMGAGESNPAPFLVGHVPLVTSAEPKTVAPGDLVVVGGRGFTRDRARNSVQIGGAKALVVSASDTELKVVVPRQVGGESERLLEVRVPGSEYVGQTKLTTSPPPEGVEFRFVAEPFDASPGRDHAVLATGLGPAFVLAAAGGRSAAERAVEAERRFNDAAAAVRASRDVTFEVREQEKGPALAMTGRPELLLEVTPEDAAAYNEDWTGLRGRGGPVSPPRLARWWEAVAKDLVLLLVRGEKPQYAAALAPEGRVFLDVFQAAQKSGRTGIPLPVLAKPAIRDGLRLVAFRVPPSVVGPTGPVGPAPAPSASGPPPLQLEGSWVGTETEAGTQRYVTAVFRKESGSISYEGTVTLTVPLITLERPQKDTVTYSLMVRGGMRYCVGKWDGETLSGKIATDATGADVIGNFQLRPR